jgi:hypothetical protein
MQSETSSLRRNPCKIPNPLHLYICTLYRCWNPGTIIAVSNTHAAVPIPFPQRNLRISETCFRASFPQDVLSERPLSVSCLPTSFPIAYPAPKPTTETKTTTPALTTQVSSVGLIIASSAAAIFFFFVTLGWGLGLLATAFLLPFSPAASWSDIDGLLRGRVLGLRGREVTGGVPMSSDSGTRRSPVNSGRVEVLALGIVFWFRFGRPRAAAAHERSVVKLARSAASWST